MLSGDSLSSHKDRPFSTKDADRDSGSSNCAVYSHGSISELMNFKTVGSLPVGYRVEELKLDHMFNIINAKAP